MPRRDIRMDSCEVDDFLRTQSTAVVVGVAASGSPWGSIGRLHYQHRTVAFSLRNGDELIRVLAADDRACCIVEHFPSYYEIIGVMLHGHVTRRIAGRSDETTFDLHVDKVVSFDFGKLADSW